MPRHRASYDPRAVHCPHCGAEPGQPCRSPGGSSRRVDDGERSRLAYGLKFPEENVGRADAERYRMKYPDVCVDAIVCAPSRAQVRWWERWGKAWTYDQTMYEREHGRDTSIEDLPVVEVADEEFVGISVSELLAQFDKVKVPKKK